MGEGVKTARELSERLQSDEAFAEKFKAAVKAVRQSGAKDKYDAFCSAAAEYGYAVSREELDEVAQRNGEEVSEEELGKLAGGSCWWIITASFLADYLFS